MSCGDEGSEDVQTLSLPLQIPAMKSLMVAPKEGWLSNIGGGRALTDAGTDSETHFVRMAGERDVIAVLTSRISS